MERLIMVFIIYAGWSVLKNLLKIGLVPQQGANKTGNRPAMNQVNDSLFELRSYSKRENRYYETANKKIQREYEQDRKETVLKNDEKKVESNPILTNQNEIRNEKTMSDFFNFSQSSILDGIIMAEILGKPKAKRK